MKRHLPLRLLLLVSSLLHWFGNWCGESLEHSCGKILDSVCHLAVLFARLLLPFALLIPLLNPLTKFATIRLPF